MSVHRRRVSLHPILELRGTRLRIRSLSRGSFSWALRASQASADECSAHSTRWIIEGADKGLERGKVEAWIGPQLVHKRTKK